MPKKQILIDEEVYWELLKYRADNKIRNWSDAIWKLLCIARKVENLERSKNTKVGELERSKVATAEEGRPTKKQLGYLEGLINRVLARGEVSDVLREALEWLKENVDKFSKEEISQMINWIKEERYGNVVSLIDGKRYG